MRIFFFLLILIPIVEIAVLIKVGSIIGVLPTVGLILLTAMLGVYLLRQQSWKTLSRAQAKMGGGQLPAKEMAEGLFLAVGGALLLTPGFVTDAIGFCCLLPGSRLWLMSILVEPIVKSFMSNPNARFSTFTMNTQSQSFRSQHTDFQGSVFKGSDPQSPGASEGQRPSERIHEKDQTSSSGGDVIDGEFKREDE